MARITEKISESAEAAGRQQELVHSRLHSSGRAATESCRSRDDRIVAGVAGGMADYFGINPTIVRILWILAFLPGGVPGLALYVLCWLLMPSEPYTMRRWD